MQDSVKRFLRNISNCHLKCTNIPEQGRFFFLLPPFYSSVVTPQWYLWQLNMASDWWSKLQESSVRSSPCLALPPLSCAMPALRKPLRDAGYQVITYLWYHLGNALLPQEQGWWGQRLNEMYSKAVKTWGCNWWTMEAVTHAERLQSFSIAQSARRCISILLKAHYYL